ncbi:hypothetical protein [Siccibacter turicensis]|nr:hypothetical protein [Siccibacter turicensis]
MSEVTSDLVWYPPEFPAQVRQVYYLSAITWAETYPEPGMI